MIDDFPQDRTRKERAKARKLRATQWWRRKLAEGLCHYCGGEFTASDLTMDHLVPLSRGGKSTRGNVVPSCKKCNNKKKYYTPAEIVLRDDLDSDLFF